MGCLDRYSDILHGSDIIKAFQDTCIGGDDIVLMFLIDGAQLYVMKASACWIYIWVLLNLAPERLSPPPPGTNWVDWSNAMGREMYLHRVLEKLNAEYLPESDCDFLTHQAPKADSSDSSS